MKKLPNLPVGDSSFESIREGRQLYVDKTRHIFQMADQGKYYFISRPRRFGKSLTVSTLKCLFQGKKELFEGLWIADNTDLEWKEHPVVIIDFDGTGFGLQPTVPCAWQPKGETTGVPSSRSRRLSVAGFFNTGNNDFHCLTFKCSVDSDMVTACFGRFSEKIDGEIPTFVIIDNAPTHTSGKFTECTEKWAEKGLFIIYLPTYSPELNLIEILWRFIRYSRLPFSACLSFKNLVEEVEKILKGVGSEYVINFS